MTPAGLISWRHALCTAPILAAALPAFARPQNPVSIQWDPWYVLLPIDQPGGAARIADSRAAEEELPKHLLGKDGPDLSRVYQGKNAIVASWQPLDDKALVGSVPELGAIDFVKLMPKDAPYNETSAYLYRRVRSLDAASVACKFGYDDAARIWLNGRLVGESSRPGAFEPLADSVSLEFVEGVNHLLVKVTNAGGAWRFRLLPIDSKPLAGKALAQEKINQAIDRGCDFLISQQLRDGSWGYDDSRFPGGQTALAAYALLKSGIPPRHQAIQRAIAHLKARPTRHTYTAGCTLLALWALHDDTNNEWIADIADELMSWQQAGLWGYPEGDADLSNTQYAVLGLYAAAHCGVKVPPKLWRDVIGQVLHYQGRAGGFGYHIGDSGNPTGSMTAAGLSALAISKAQLTDDNTKQMQGQALVDQGLELGARWLSTHFTITGSPPNDPKGALDAHWGPYYLYGVERTCTLLKLDRLGGSDWYWEGASWFLDIQRPSGEFPTAWADGEPNTCFGLLFLGRATQAFTGKSTAKKDTIYKTDDAKSDVWLRATGDVQLALWLGGFSKRVFTDYGWKILEPKGLHIEKVDYLVDGEVAGTVAGNPLRHWKDDKFSLLHTFDDGGAQRVAIRVTLLLEPAAKGGESKPMEIESSEVEINVKEFAAPALLEQAAAGARNLIRESETKAQASTQAADTPPTAAIDGRESSAWTCAPDDKNPSLTLEFERPVRASQVVFSGLGGRADSTGDWDRATKVELRVNKIDPVYVVELDRDELRTTMFEIPRQGAIRSLEIKILERVTGKKYPGRAGFNEIGLFHQAATKR